MIIRCWTTTQCKMWFCCAWSGMEGVVDACSAKANPEHQHIEHPCVHISSISPQHSPYSPLKEIRVQSTVGNVTSKPELNQGFTVFVSDWTRYAWTKSRPKGELCEQHMLRKTSFVHCVRVVMRCERRVSRKCWVLALDVTYLCTFVSAQICQ